MAKGRQGHATCKTSHSINPHSSQLLCAPTSLKVGVGGTFLAWKGRYNPGSLKHRL